MFKVPARLILIIGVFSSLLACAQWSNRNRISKGDLDCLEKSFSNFKVELDAQVKAGNEKLEVGPFDRSVLFFDYVVKDCPQWNRKLYHEWASGRLEVFKGSPSFFYTALGFIDLENRKWVADPAIEKDVIPHSEWIKRLNAKTPVEIETTPVNLNSKFAKPDFIERKFR